MGLLRNICWMMSLAQHTEFRKGKTESKEMRWCRCFSVLGSTRPPLHSSVMSSTSWLSWTTFDIVTEYWTSTTNDSTHYVWSFLWSECRQMVFGVDVCDFDFWIQIGSIEQPIINNCVRPGNMSHCGTSSFNDHLDHCFVVFKHIQHSFSMRKLEVWGNTINVIQKRWSSLEIACLAFDLCHNSQRVVPFDRGSELRSKN